MYNYRFLLIFDAARCLANGDPETGLQRLIGDRALISQYCIKNKVKKYLAENNEDILHYDLSEKVLIGDKLGNNKDEKEYLEEAKKYLDVRLFGICDLAKKIAINAQGPVSLENAISIDPVNMVRMNVNRNYRVSVNEKGDNDGSSFNIPVEIMDYAMFTCFGGTNRFAAQDLGLSDEDMDKFFVALKNMFEEDFSVARPAGSMNINKLIVWKWEGKSKYSNKQLRESVCIRKKEDICFPQSENDYEIVIEKLEGIETYIF